MNKPIVIRDILEFQKFRKTITETVGFVPTMGALHQGHASLMKKASSENDVAILSLFVNPTQFNDPKDFKNYPQTFDADCKLAKDCGISVIFFPTYEDIYPDQYRYQLHEKSFSALLCGQNRPGHFNGVLTIVMKLFNIVQPQKAYFGEKDYQQLRLIQDMVKSFFMNIQIVPCKTVREESGLAMSSRNLRLTNDGQKKASQIFKTITQKIPAEKVKDLLNQDGFVVDYVEDIEGRRYVAAHLEGVRLIDNVEI